MPIAIRTELPSQAELLALYDSVGWTSYTGDPAQLRAAVEGSFLVLCARDETDGSLLGLARTISDGVSIAYLQDLLVAPSHHRAGIGGRLLDEVLQRTKAIRQFVLLTDAEPGQRAFYQSRGLVETRDTRPGELRAFVRIG